VGKAIGLAEKAETAQRRAVVDARHRRSAGSVERRRAGLPATPARAQRDRLVVEDGSGAREAGDGGLAAARRSREHPGASSIHHGGRVQEHSALLHEEEAAQQPEQVGVERGSGTRTKGDPVPSQIALGARGMAREREAASVPGGPWPRRGARTIALAGADVHSEARSTPRQERAIPSLHPGAPRRGETCDAEHEPGDFDVGRPLSQPRPLRAPGSPCRPRRTEGRPRYGS
jgi:hypothetical protein